MAKWSTSKINVELVVVLIFFYFTHVGVMEWCLTQRSKLLKAELTTRNALLVLNANINWMQPILLMDLIMKSIVFIATGKN